MKLKEYKKQILIIICIFCILIAIGLIYMTYMLNRIEANTNNSIKTIVKNDANTLKNKITEQKAILQSVTNEILSDNIIDKNKIFEIYEKSEVNSRFIRMGIMYENGLVLTNDGYELDYSNEIDNFFSNNEIHISENRKSKIDGEDINIYSQAITLDDKKIAILLIVKTDSYKDIFSNKIFEGKGFSYIVNKNAEIVVNSNTDRGTGNLIENIKEMIIGRSKQRFLENEEKIKQNIINGVSETRTLQTKFGKLYMAYEDIGINNWDIVSFIPAKAIAGEVNRALLTTFILSVIVILTIWAIFIYMSITNIKKQKQLYEYAYIDPITKQGNVYYLKKIGQEILKKENLENKYIMILDINRFKMINRAYGYKVRR